MKCVFDILCSLLGLLLLWPFFLLVAIAIMLTDGHPVFFRQLRVGQNGKDFTLYKFRSMQVLTAAEKGSFDAGSSCRVTGIGRMLRKTKLDELPQLWNVLKGDMAIVGPRPEVRKWVEIHSNRWKKVLTVRPGITDPASIKFRNEEELLAGADNPEAMYRDVILPEKLALYEEYVDNRSFFGDIALILRTLWAVVKK